MKSGIVTRSDPYLMDPSILVDPNLILDYGSSLKDEVLCSYPCNDPWMDMIHYNDTQLENIILDTGLGLCGAEYDTGTINSTTTTTASFANAGAAWSDNEFDLEEVLKGLNSQLEWKGQLESMADEAVKPEPIADMSTCSLTESDIANYEEVAYTTASTFDATSEESQSMVSDDGSEADNTTDDLDSVHSFSTQAYESPRSTRKRKISTDSIESSVTVASVVAPKRRRTTARRNKRVQDERVKNQNKVAAMKYRRKKRDEKMSMDDILKSEEEKNKSLKESVSELTVEVQVLKELLGKYLSPNQLKPSKR